MNRPVSICPRCAGVIVIGTYPQGQVVMQVEGRSFHFFCGYKEQARLQEERAKLREEAHKARKPYDFDDFGRAR